MCARDQIEVKIFNLRFAWRIGFWVGLETYPLNPPTGSYWPIIMTPIDLEGD